MTSELLSQSQFEDINGHEWKKGQKIWIYKTFEWEPGTVVQVQNKPSPWQKSRSHIEVADQNGEHHTFSYRWIRSRLEQVRTEREHAYFTAKEAQEQAELLEKTQERWETDQKIWFRTPSRNPNNPDRQEREWKPGIVLAVKAREGIKDHRPQFGVPIPKVIYICMEIADSEGESRTFTYESQEERLKMIRTEAEYAALDSSVMDKRKETKQLAKEAEKQRNKTRFLAKWKPGQKY